jgi:hypothetical protein
MIKNFRAFLLISIFSLHSSLPLFAMDDDKEIINRIKHRISISKDKIRNKEIKIRDLEILLQKLEIASAQQNTLPKTVNPNNPESGQQSLPKPDFTGMNKSSSSKQGISPKSPRLPDNKEAKLFKQNSPLVIENMARKLGKPTVLKMAEFGDGNVDQNFSNLMKYAKKEEGKIKEKREEALIKALKEQNLSVQDYLTRPESNINNNNRLSSDDESSSEDE